MGFNMNAINLVSDRGEHVSIECVDASTFSFDILLRGTAQVIARIRDIRLPPNKNVGTKNRFTLEVDTFYKDIIPFLITTSLAIDEYKYSSTIEQKRKNCDR